MLPVRYRTQAGRPLISVTQVLRLTGRINADWFTDEAALRGSTVHALTEQLDRGEAITIPAGLDGYVEAYREFLAVVRPTWTAIELPVTSEALGFAGRIDRVGTLFGLPALLDIKSGAESDWHGLQLGAYNLLHPTGVRWACYLTKTGRYLLRCYDDPQDYRKFEFDLAASRGLVWPDGDHWRLR